MFAGRFRSARHDGRIYKVGFPPTFIYSTLPEFLAPKVTDECVTAI